MRKSRWIACLEWIAFALVVLFVVGVLAMRHEITSADLDNPVAPRESLQEQQ
jgi:uncharacterized membrane protein YdfJ with MMPL/SSD domain